MDTRQARQIFVSFDDDRLSYTFRKYSDGLYFYDTSTTVPFNDYSNKPVNSYLFLQTVESNKNSFSKKDIARANAAQALQQRLGFPGTTTLVSYLRQNLLTNASVRSDDVHQGTQIYGPLPQLLKSSRF